MTAVVRARHLGIPFDGQPGSLNAITDVTGVEVGMVTLAHAHTGVTAILPRGRDGVGVPCAAGRHVLNGNGEMTGSVWIDERGAVDLPIMITGTPSVGTVYAGTVDWITSRRPDAAGRWQLPTVCETWDGYLSDPLGHHVLVEHAGQALDSARGGSVPEGTTGGGTGMNCYEFKAGSGTASRVVQYRGDSHTVAAFLQANFGRRSELTIAGVPVGAHIPQTGPTVAQGPLPSGSGSVIVVIATDAPLLPDQCRALARRVPLGLARTGASGSHFSGDLFLALSTANAGALTSSHSARVEDPPYEEMRFMPWGQLDPLFAAVVQCTEEAVVNALVAGRDTVGHQGHESPGLPHETVRDLVAGLRSRGQRVEPDAAKGLGQ